LKALKTLKISDHIEVFKFILVMVDYIPSSSLLDLEKIAALPFSDQIKVFQSGFGMWEISMKPTS
jgi:hypothetical protein